jgi:hydrogenase expression/formation protein HypE
MKQSKIVLGHGSGGKLTKELVDEIFVKTFDNPSLRDLTDSAIVGLDARRIALTTDSYVVRPMFFPGGDLGKLAVCGTINDLSVMGAKPLFLTCGFIIEEGCDIESLKRIVSSMKRAADEAGVALVAGDTKVVEKGSGDGVFVNTSGLGAVPDGVDFRRERVKPGDSVLINGTIGDHGMAVLLSREQFGFESSLESDCAALNGLISDMMSCGGEIKFMRDATRGGLATILNEIALGMEFGVSLDEEKIPVKEDVSALSEILGMDPLYVANEGKVVAVCDAGSEAGVLDAMKRHPLGRDASVIGKIVKEPRGMVTARTRIGSRRILDMLVDDQLPRIC